jgi:hypothetical protein
MKKLLSLTVAAFLSIGSQVMAQNAEITNVLNLKSARQSGTIKEQNKIAGYYTFYFKEKQDKANSVYEIALMDNDLNSVNSFEFKRPKNSNLLEAVYNGEVFMFFFWDAKTGYEFVTFDLNGKQQGSTKMPKAEISQYDLQQSMSALSSPTGNVTIYPSGNAGFIRQSFTKGKKPGYEVVAYDNNAKKQWSYASSDASKLFESIEIGEVSESIITATVYRRKSAMSRKMDLAFLILDRNNGKKIAELNMGTEEEGKQSVLKSYIDNQNKKIVLIGEYYKPGDDMLKDLSAGMFVKEIDMEGEVLKEKTFSWKGDISKFKQQNLDEEDKKDDKPYSLFFHDVVRSADGHLFLVAEQYRKQVSAGAIAGKVLVAAAGGSSDASNLEIRVANMVVLELDGNNELVDYDIIQKRKRSVLLPSGMGLYSTAYLGYYIQMIGEFDYSFTSRDTESDEFTVLYTDANRKEEKGQKNSDFLVGIIHIKGGEKKADRIGINTEARNTWLRPAKPGYIMVAEYFRKEKVIKMRLEKLAY